MDMVAVPELLLSDHVQPLPAFLGNGSTKLSMLSLELRHVTARFGGVVVRLPHPVHYFSSAGLADVVCSVSRATVLVTSELPRSFLTGTIAVDGTTSKFPNVGSDLSCNDSECDGSDTGAIFRMQVSLIMVLFVFIIPASCSICLMAGKLVLTAMVIGKWMHCTFLG